MRVRNIEVNSENYIGQTSRFRIYHGIRDDNQPVILKVAKIFEDGDILAEEAGKFNALSAFEEELARLEEHMGDERSHYDWLFAKLSASFMEPAQGNRRINVFMMPDIGLSRLTPLTKLHAEIEIDARTSIWILGRFFKFYSFIELSRTLGSEMPLTGYPVFSPDDYFIGPERHRLVYYNFSGEVASVAVFDLVKTVSQFILDWVVAKDDAAEQEYLELLKNLSQHGRESFSGAHRDLYSLVEKLWRFKYHPFTYRERTTVTWKSITTSKEG